MNKELYILNDRRLVVVTLDEHKNVYPEIYQYVYVQQDGSYVPSLVYERLSKGFVQELKPLYNYMSEFDYFLYKMSGLLPAGMFNELGALQ